MFIPVKIRILNYKLSYVCPCVFFTCECVFLLDEVKEPAGKTSSSCLLDTDKLGVVGGAQFLLLPKDPLQNILFNKYCLFKLHFVLYRSLPVLQISDAANGLNGERVLVGVVKCLTDQVEGCLPEF